MSEKVIYVVGGPTASGKSAYSLDLAAKVDGVIINADSMQVYDGLPILTAQPSSSDQKKFLHKLYGVLHPNQSCSAGNWRLMVEPIIHEIFSLKKTPIIVGGSGLYINALLYGLSPIPDIPDDIRKAASQKQKALGNPAFHNALAERDPIMAARLDPFNSARLIRAWEVLDATGKSLAEWQELPRELPPEDWLFDVRIMLPRREVLHEKCDRRLEWMIENGALEELETFNTLIEKGDINADALLTHALGAEPLSAYLNGQLNKAIAIERAQGETRRYAKRQVTWFKHQIRQAPHIKSIEKIII